MLKLNLLIKTIIKKAWGQRPCSAAQPCEELNKYVPYKKHMKKNEVTYPVAIRQTINNRTHLRLISWVSFLI